MAQGGPPATTHQMREAKLASVVERPNARFVCGFAPTAKLSRPAEKKTVQGVGPIDGGFEIVLCRWIRLGVGPS